MARVEKTSILNNSRWFAFLGMLVQHQHVVWVEDFIDGKYEKFLSNGGYVNKSISSPQALAHFSWVLSKGRFIVVDLQGVRGSKITVLTDPAIHSVDRSFGSTDFGILGMKWFFETHECNDVCKQLGIDKTVPNLSSIPNPWKVENNMNTRFTDETELQSSDQSTHYSQNVSSFNKEILKKYRKIISSLKFDIERK
jgi:hypothetical protein